MDRTVTRAAQMEGQVDPAADLAAALAAGGVGLRLDLQPICAASSLTPVGYEALLRWEHPVLGAVSALDTLAAAEAGGRIVALEAWTLVTAFRLRASWPSGGPYLAVNVSAAGILEGHAAPMIRAALGATGVEPRGILVELPEAAVARDIPAALDLTGAIRRLGIAAALDDFGGTHGSARILRDIAFAAVKIDPELTGGLEGGGPAAGRARAMVTAVVEMAHAMGATAIAEAVETAGQMSALRDAGCDALQGWLLGRPGPAT
ncbi:EAL domain-containing protein [Roseomonas eburnea]|uniref:EAL domain-containing protein n=1 Tax=Neoroseomonas eburnea TaxID=1346889 RepID=A0A9X9X7S4_9PROT|nr:EAL domain-containing protein [Neoroseomonas eburnea]MBR0679760.1 EAL domain-containing protein [Neoroseomonas eburnea]